MLFPCQQESLSGFGKINAEFRKFNFRKGGFNFAFSFGFADENKGEVKVFAQGKIPFRKRF